METVTGTEIRDFRIRGNHFNWRSLLSRRERHSSKKENVVPNHPGYSPPVVDFDLRGGATGSIVVGESDIPLLCDDDLESAKRCLSLILEARQGDPRAAKDPIMRTPTKYATIIASSAKESVTMCDP